MSDYPPVAPLEFCDFGGGNRIHIGFPWPCCRIRRRSLYVKMNVICASDVTGVNVCQWGGVL